MPTNGLKFAGEISQSAPEVIYTPGANVAAVCNVNILNAGSNNVAVRLGYNASATTVASAYIEFGAILSGGGVLERTGIVLSGTQTLIAECETASAVYVTCWAVEDSQ